MPLSIIFLEWVELNNMKNKKDLIKEVVFDSSLNIEEQLMLDFYDEAFPNKNDFLTNNWKWINNPDYYDYKYPNIATHEGKVVGQLNFTPFTAVLNGEKLGAGWGGDLIVLKNYRGSYIAIRLIEDYLKKPLINFAFVNINSYNLLIKRYDWTAHENSYMHFFSLAPLKKKSIPTLFRKTGNAVAGIFLKLLYRKYAVPKSKIEIKKVDKESIKGLVDTLENHEPNTIYPLYDINQLTWRLLKSPYSDSYRVFSFPSLNIDVAVNLYLHRDSTQIDLMYIPPKASNEAIQKIIASIAIWSIKNNYQSFRYFTTDKTRSTFLKDTLKSSIGKQLCIFFSSDDALYEKMKNAAWRWQIIDSDLEKFAN